MKLISVSLTAANFRKRYHCELFRIKPSKKLMSEWLGRPDIQFLIIFKEINLKTSSLGFDSVDKVTETRIGSNIFLTLTSLKSTRSNQSRPRNTVNFVHAEAKDVPLWGFLNSNFLCTIFDRTAALRVFKQRLSAGIFDNRFVCKLQQVSMPAQDRGYLIVIFGTPCAPITNQDGGPLPFKSVNKGNTVQKRNWNGPKFKRTGHEYKLTPRPIQYVLPQFTFFIFKTRKFLDILFLARHKIGLLESWVTVVESSRPKRLEIILDTLERHMPT